jgi:DNA polymerase I
MQVIANHTGLRLDEVCHRGMTSIWNKILNDSISKKISSIGYDHLPIALRKLYSNHQTLYAYYRNSDDDFDSEIEEEIEDELERDEKEPNGEREVNFEQEPIGHRKTNNPRRDARQVFRKYKGAIVLEPIRGLHHDVCLFDVTSLYPTMIIKYNLSPETLNCSCCKDDPRARQMFTPEILKDCKFLPMREGCYWICRCRQGLFAQILEGLTEDRIKYNRDGLELENQAIKALINSGYGVFGHPYFKYYDPRVAELVTAFGRDTLTKMQVIANGLGFVTLYGDTDSLFVNNVKRIEDAHRFADECKSMLGVEVGHEKTFSKLLLVGKKHYVGILSDPSKEPNIKGMEGIKSDRPEFIHRAFMLLVQDIKNATNPIPKLRQAFQQLDCRQVPPESLAISLVLRKNPEEYSQVCKQSRLGVKLGLRMGDTLVYYKCDMQQPVYDVESKRHTLRTIYESENQDDISYAEYKKMLMNSMKELLEILGYDAEKELLSTRQLVNSIYFRRTTC